VLTAFEQQLITVLTEGFVGPPPAGEPRVSVLTSAGEAPGANVDVVISADLRQARVWPDFGDDSLVERREGDVWRLRTELALEGDASILLAAVTGTPTEQRTRLLQALDRLLVALDPPDVRQGRAFATDADEGFALEAFRFVRLDPDPANAPDPARVRVTYAWKGRFWPVRVDPEGPAISRIPTRIAVLPMRLPDRLVVRAGSGANPVPVRIDLRAHAGAAPRLFARIKGLGPGQLVGSGAAAADGFVGSEAGADGVFPLTYAPPGAVASRTQLAIEFSLGSPAGRTVLLDELQIEVVPA
jgi:hypothetical protein